MKCLLCSGSSIGAASGIHHDDRIRSVLSLPHFADEKQRTRESKKFVEGHIVWDGTKIQTLCIDLHHPSTLH